MVETRANTEKKKDPVKGDLDCDALDEKVSSTRPDVVRYEAQNYYHGVTRLGRIDFPRFDGSRIKEWLFKAEEFFVVDFTPDNMKVKTAAIHFDSHAAASHHSFVKSRVGLEVLYDWEGYVQMLLERFEDVCDEPMAELKQLQETDGIVDYHQKFVLIKLRVNLSEAYLAHPKKPFTTTWSLKLSNAGPTIKYTKENDVRTDQQWGKGSVKSINPTPRKLSQQEMSERRAKGLCYLCDEKYTPEHYLVHKKTQLFSLDVGDEFVDAEEVLWDECEVDPKGMPQISVNAISGISDHETMRVKGTYDKKILFIFIDSSSTHNFVDSKMVAKLGCKVESAGLSLVSVADGWKLAINGKVKDFTWKLQDTTFQSDVLMIPLQGIDMVLGVQWLKTLGPITWEFEELEMGFKYKGQRVLLYGLKSGSVRDVKAQKLQKVQEDQAQFALLCVQKKREEESEDICTLSTLSTEAKVDTVIGQLVEGFPDLFVEPTELPPFKAHHNHKIKLLEGSNPVNQRPYRYAIHQKNEIDKIVEEMLSGSTIQVNSSPYASPVVLVKKKDGSWRLCVDYRELNGNDSKGSFSYTIDR
ncbi:PREDICTED: uncharacterized protein LOC104750484 [Camelina sativa]|uniref:Uncharacterized protein LOC104750484 n=1 Tax=Camelina sativa TaxID=90675 RepID=A0ABM0WG23_CAMSA|nr:PREDICTED: uncharacterized protein LOC104750484 [Camelina sativa]